MSAQSIEIRLIGDIAEIGQADWDACACPEVADGGPPHDPFTTFRFLSALEESGSVGPGTGWQQQHLAAFIDGHLIAVAPLYAKMHSQGEYVFDHNWAHAFERAGGTYYPKLQVAVPHTPATGRRFLTRPGFEGVGRQALMQGAVQVTQNNNLSSAHVTFCTQEEARIGGEMGLMVRKGQQFHWRNNGYADFGGFLASLNARKRKNIRKERAQAQGFGGHIHQFSGEDIQPEHWDAFWQFYQDTGSRKWGTPYLTRAFFDIAQESLREDMVLVLAEKNGRWIAGALNFIGRDTLFGRYWGCVEHHPFLHFELCYYQAIDIAIARGLGTVEAGAQGEHKLARGYLPTATWSLHWMRDAGFARAVGDYLQAERDAVDQEIEILTEYGPFKRARVEEQE
ncbi:N-acetyltransferase [Sulfitobacter sp. M57]|uniref:GNAT family N-acetyltransferase n=1 Tax=unclassified Sulfitobacter TaxID=196795 RepID=UPI0023E22F1C|nr:MULTISPECIES: GNAT family N-acetyltransferase [unclassified Sulfitobacter]MDF3414709.1 N-acetyltransferase [Sulfitobacter sp. KE5]MDF3422190.1 N-acetyltransferase [Sulfitobacter sp. KE43]MDF3433255.1 N-acetyltransferase [Sulfitobacter sp. KE42]MDF3458895.1 N-acetyltransferase [Sulfitobacter sp. S74]MDF3462794.1 N-acetyltransferase [Sulfitobacter sp. Ks18]